MSLRLHLASERETIVRPYLARAIEDCAAINATENRWAILRVIPTGLGALVSVEIGRIHSDGTEETKIETRWYTQDADGKVDITKQTHV